MKDERDETPVSERDEKIPPAGRLSRVGKLGVGSWQLFAVATILPSLEYLQTSHWSPSLWVLVGLAIWLFSFAVNLGFPKIRRWGSRPAAVVGGVAASMAAVQAVTGAGVEGPPLTTFLLAITVYTHAHVGLCHVLAAVVGLDGCEMRVLPWFAARWRGVEPRLAICPGIWTPVDRWEARLRASSGAAG